VVTGLKPGMATITAKQGELSGQAAVSVTAAMLKAITVTPTNPTLAKGTTQPFVATGTYSDDSKQDLTASVTWASSNAAVATISNAMGSKGLATAVAPGTATISAALGGASGNTTLTVTAAALVSISVTPAMASATKGGIQQFTATGVYSDQSTKDITTSVNWSSSNTAVATVSNAAGSQGLATAGDAGTATISAALGGLGGGATLTVTAAVLRSIAVTPANTSVAKGTTQK
jgi:hypothetical protein